MSLTEMGEMWTDGTGNGREHSVLRLVTSALTTEEYYRKVRPMLAG